MTDAIVQPPTRRHLGAVATASGVSAVAGYVVIVVTARILSVEQNAQFLVFWSLAFFCFGLLGGIQNETTRAVRSAQLNSMSGVRPLPVALALGAAVSLVLLASQRAWATEWFPVSARPVVFAISLGVILFAGHSALVGTLAGQGEWNSFSFLIAAEAVMRLLLVLLAIATGWLVGGIELATCLAAGAWIVLCLASGKYRSALRARGDTNLSTFLRQGLQATAATAATSALVVGFPVLLRITSSSLDYASAAPLILAISFTRAPLMLVVNAFQGVAITSFVSAPEYRRALLFRLLAAVGAVGALGAVAAAMIGPWLLELMLGQGYRVSAGVLSTLMLASVLLAALTLTGAAALALSRHLLYASGWLAALVGSLASLAMPGDITQRALMALLVGPIVGLVVHVLGLRRDLDKVHT